jgi:hypothetical protein
MSRLKLLYLLHVQHRLRLLRKETSAPSETAAAVIQFVTDLVLIYAQKPSPLAFATGPSNPFVIWLSNPSRHSLASSALLRPAPLALTLTRMLSQTSIDGKYIERVSIKMCKAQKR